MRHRLFREPTTIPNKKSPEKLGGLCFKIILFRGTLLFTTAHDQSEATKA
ncbi:hypothetical protein NT6N_22480 [Oceaniferula spumae]|uniref:Uncharacterized protein n=1 Tax=Oceaniferula spumae TaxID=2979115 RepID=A0AAT9FML4_9BACT